MEESKKVPAIRFKGFTGEWEERKFGDIVNIRRGLTYTPDDLRGNGIRVLRSSNIDDDRFVTNNDDVFVTQEAINIDYAKNNDILITAANGSNRLVGKHALITGIDDESAVPGGFMLIGSTEESAFVNASMSSPWYAKFINLFVAGGNGAIGNLNKNDLQNQIFYIPDKIEQKQLGYFFQSLDNLISLHQRKHEQLLNIKESMLEKMFPKDGADVPEIRFAGFTEPWVQYRLKDFGVATNGTSLESEFNKNGRYKVISIGSYSEDGKYRDQGLRADLNDKTKNRILNKDDIVMILNDKTSSGNIIGRVLMIDTNDRYIYNQRTERIEVNKEIFMPSFLFHLLNADNIRSQIINSSQGNTQIYVNWSNIQELFYKVPKAKQEQKCIADFFTGLDNIISSYLRKLDQLQNIKKFFQGKMLI